LSNALHFLVLDAYPREIRAALRRVGAAEAGELYARLLRALEPDATVDVLYPADPDAALPYGAALAAYDGVAWTGSSLSVYVSEDARVRRQVELVRATYAAGVPSFGSCWAAQLSVVAAGGRCAAHPQGREFGISRRITLSAAGRAHPMYAGKAAVFDALTSHADEVVELPAGAALLASNAFSNVQAVAVTQARGTFWAVQYHPEYDLHDIARLCVLRTDELVRQGTFADPTAAHAYVEQLEALHRDPTRHDLVHELQVDPALLDGAQRQLEVRNWIELLVKGAAASRRPQP